jgi:hopanoid-associated phosphorylase
MEAPAGLLIISGLMREAGIFTGAGITTICGDAATLEARLAAVANPLPRMILSAGICGGLDPSLQRASIVLGTEVVARSERIGADATVLQALMRHLTLAGERVVLGSVATADTPVVTAEAKAELRARTGAIAVDMESLIAGRFAAARTLPFAILRAVSDPADRNLPPLVLNAVFPDGSLNVARVMVALIRRPGQLTSLLAAARDSAAAFRTLRRCRSFPGLLLQDLAGPHL